MYINKEFTINEKKLKIETGRVAKNTGASILINYDETVLLTTVVFQENNAKDFFPLKVDYSEKYYASGKIPGNYLKREGKPSDREILIARLVDRSVRPMFPKDFFHDVQINITVISINPEINPDILAIISTSIALSISGLPFSEPIAATRICYDGKKYFLNPLVSEQKNSILDLVISGTKDNILMIESSSNEIKKDAFLDAIKIGQSEIKKLLEFIFDFKKECVIKYISYNKINYESINNIINVNFINDLKSAYNLNDLNIRSENIKKIKSNLLLNNDNNIFINKSDLQYVLNEVEKDIIRNKILNELKRLDNREISEIREISIELGFLKRIHGSVLFTRGETQAIVTVTLGSQKDAQSIDCVFNEHQKHDFMLHYNFPNYSVNEIGSSTGTKRREIGHGNLAKKSLQSILPENKDFPYVIRIVSEITESNGSSSMATVCGGSLALMNAGVPTKNHVAGIAMGLIKNDDKYIILTDISGNEDHVGDMDFKITSTEKGITSLQMDLKISGLDISIFNEILDTSINGLKKILKIMNNSINKSSDILSKYVPKIRKININKNKIKYVIGKGGATINSLAREFDCKIDIDNEGCVSIASSSDEKIDLLIDKIYVITNELKTGIVLKGKATKITQFGCFINIMPHKDGLLHISKINKYKSDNPGWDIREGDILNVIISKIDDNDRISLDISN